MNNFKNTQNTDTSQYDFPTSIKHMKEKKKYLKNKKKYLSLATAASFLKKINKKSNFSC